MAKQDIQIQKRTVSNAQLLKAGIYEKWFKKEYSDYTGSEQALGLIKSYEDNILEFVRTGTGGILKGNNGTGKTLLLNILFKRLIGIGFRVKVIYYPRLVEAYLNRSKSTEFNEYLNADFLGIDDIGKGYQLSDKSIELGIATLDYVLRYRTQRLKPTWLTTNMLLKEFKETYKESIASLLKEIGSSIDVNGSDKRDKYFKKNEF